MKNPNQIGIILLGTNSYFILAIRFIVRFRHFYLGNKKIRFYLFSDTNPMDYLNDCHDIEFCYITHTDWVTATNSKFESIISIKEKLLNDTDYVFYFDADTNIKTPFVDDWFLGDMVGGEHFGNNFWMKDCKGYDRNPKSKSYVPFNTTLEQIYYLGAFFGGKSEVIIKFCELMMYHQSEDKKISYEPGVNDESYINQHFHYNPPSKIIKCTDFQFTISDKGGLGETRNTSLSTNEKKELIRNNRGVLFDIVNDRVVFK